MSHHIRFLAFNFKSLYSFIYASMPKNDKSEKWELMFAIKIIAITFRDFLRNGFILRG